MTSRPASDGPVLGDIPPPAKRPRRAKARREEVVKPKICCVCMDKLPDEKPLAYQCHGCYFGTYCAGCLATLFLRATHDESEMPVNCGCRRQISVDAVKDTLSTEQIEEFKRKLEEWATGDRLYCPKPTCSAFIAPRLYALSKHAQPFRANLIEWSAKDNEYDPSKYDPTVSCPECALNICTNCRKEAHEEDLDQNRRCTRSRDPEMDPLTLEKLKKTGCKNCPRCHRAVRLMSGCSHIRCPCGVHFCYNCGQSLVDCPGSEECLEDPATIGDDEDGDDDEDDDEEDDGYDDDDGDEYGPDEPYPFSKDDEGNKGNEDGEGNGGANDASADDQSGPNQGVSRPQAENGTPHRTNHTTPADRMSIAFLNNTPSPPVVGAIEALFSLDPLPAFLQPSAIPDDVDLDLFENSSILDLGLDPDELQPYQCQHRTWSKISPQASYWHQKEPIICQWCKKAVAKPPDNNSSSAASSSSSKQTPPADIDAAQGIVCTMCYRIACMQCGIKLGVFINK